MVTPDRWNQIDQIFHNALKRPMAERGAYVAQVCGENADLRCEIESLLANDAGAATVFDSLVGDDLRDMVLDSDSAEIGRQVGPYRLVRELDSGGMGVVYLAVRSDDQYFQIVAVKTIRKDMASPELVQRFRAERQTLATLTHPNIATILDGGETEDGRPFIVMEYVEGQPITLASETRKLSIRQRIELFRSVCCAAHHAHQNSVIHRDIKPSNVLVTSQGVVKLIDFGVSKPLRSELIPGQFPQTEGGQRLMTPDYASPEQMLEQPLGTATDIYSLGVLLYELLTGSRPYTLAGLTPAGRERVVCQQEYRKPSECSGLSQQARKQLAGDLDRIILMAMDKDPSGRYPSALHFEEDLSRFLQGKPVLARKATTLYRLRKFVQRHQLAALMACTTALILGGTILLYSVQSRLADRRLKQAATLADSAISDMTEKLQQSPASVETQAALFHSALSYLDQLTRSSGDDPRLLLQLSKAYERVGDLEGSPYVANLGNAGTTMTSYEEALRLATVAHSRLPGDESTRTVIEAHEKLGEMEYFLGQIQKAREDYQQSLSLAREFWQQKPDDSLRRRLLAKSYAHIGDLQYSNLEIHQALDSFRAAFEAFGKTPKADEDNERTLIGLYLRMAGALSELGSQSDAVANDQTAIALAEDLAQRSPSEPQVQRLLGTVYSYVIEPAAGTEVLNVGDSRLAQFYARKSLVIAEKLAAIDAKNVQARHDLAFAYERMGDSLRLSQPTTAVRWYRKSLALTKETVSRYPLGGEAQEWIAFRDEELAAVLGGREHAIERLHLLEEANGIWKELASASPGKQEYRITLMRSDCKLTDAELESGDLTKAWHYVDLFRPLLEEFKTDSPSLTVLREIAFCNESMGDLQRVEMDRAFSASEKEAARAASRQWYQKSAAVWDEWNRRGAATPESEIERRKVERLLSRSSPQ
jgi:tetratricopeptide (TPR) repeat protein